MDNKTKAIVGLYQGAKMSYGVGDVNVDTEKISKLISFLYSPGLSFQVVFDFYNLQFIHTSESVKALLGENSITYQPDIHFSHIHPEDAEHYSAMEELVFHFIYNVIPKYEMLYYKTSFQYRLRKADGDYGLFLHQAIAIGVDGEGNLSKTFCSITDISHLSDERNNSLAMIGFDGRPDYYNIKSKDDFIKRETIQKLYSTKEIEVLHLISEGLDLDEMAKKLNLSSATIRTHRQNILSKSKQNKMTSIIADCIRAGII